LAQAPSRFNPEPEPTTKIRESGGAILPIGAVADTQFLKRVGGQIVGAAGGGGGGYNLIQDEGAPLPVQTTFNIVGPGITAADDIPNARTNITVSTASAVGLANANAEGAADTLARSNHTHKRDVRIAKAGVDVGTRNRINYLDGSNITISPVDDAGSDEIDTTISWTGVSVQKNSGATVGTRRNLNFIEGTNVTLAVGDDPGNDQIDITITTTTFAPVTHALLSATHSDTLASAPVRGSVIVANATPAWARVAVGGAATFLRSDGTDTTFSAIQAADYPDFVASGGGHAKGAVPDPGAVGGATKFLREDATWAVPAGGTPAADQWEFPPGARSNLSGISNASLSLQPFNFAWNLNATKAAIMMSQGSTSNSSGGLSISIAIYTRNGSTLSLASSGSQSYSWTSGTGPWSSFSGIKNWTVPVSFTLTPGQYWYAVWVRTTNAGTYSILGGPPGLSYLGEAGVASNTSQQMMDWLGFFSVSITTAMPSSIASNALQGGGSTGVRVPWILLTAI
jgi:hypothetical protein